MTKKRLFPVSILINILFLLTAGCQPQKTTFASTESATEFITAASQSQKAVGILMWKQPNTKQLLPKIYFEKTVYDFNDIGPGTKNTCEFKFTNTGHALLKIEKIESTCGCTIPTLSKKEYKHGEEGVIKIKYSGKSKSGPMKKHIYVSTNDQKNVKVMLTIKATIVPQIEVEPQELQLSLSKKNAGIPPIVLKSKDGSSFSIKHISASSDVIKISFDPNIVADKFTLAPNVDMKKLRKYRKGKVKIDLTHPKCRSVTLPYEVPAKFQVQPSKIIIHNVEPNEIQIREILIKNIEKKEFEIESIFSKHGQITVISQQPDNNSIRLKLQIVSPPTEDKRRYFRDDLIIKIKKNLLSAVLVFIAILIRIVHKYLC